MARDEEFAAFVRGQGTRLLRFATLLAGDRDAGEDLLQTVLEKVYRRWSSVGMAAAPEAYVREALVNSARRSWRRRTSHPEQLVDQLPEVAVGGGQGHVDERHMLMASLAALTKQQRAVVVLRYFDDQSEAEVARMLGCSVGTVKAHASRGLDRLRKHSGLISGVNAAREA